VEASISTGQRSSAAMACMRKKPQREVAGRQIRREQAARVGLPQNRVVVANAAAGQHEFVACGTGSVFTMVRGGKIGYFVA
jgi:hypothetical protein